MKKAVLVKLFVIFAFAYFLRVLFLPHLSLTFGYDQARDAVAALEIAHGHLKIFGPPSSTPGLFHGVLYYYVLAPAYLFGKGSPIIAAYWMALLNASVVFLVYLLTFFLTKKRSSSFLAAFLFAISFEATQYATWLSNPTLGIFTVPLLYLGLWTWVSEKKLYGPVLAALGLGLSIQSEIFLVYHTVPLLIWLYIARKNITKKQVLIFAFSLAISLSTMLIAQLKFGLGGTLNGIKQLALSDNANLAYTKSIGDYLVLYLNQVGRIFAFNSYPGNIGYGGGLIIGLIIYSLTTLKTVKNKLDPKLFLSTWLLSHLSVVTVGGLSTPFLMVGIGPAVSILLAIFIMLWWQKGYKPLALLVFGILLFGNITMIFSQNKNGSTLFSIQKDMLLSKQVQVLDYTYKQADGKDFSINTLTSPLWINIVWSYLYNWYALPKYGYLPTWHGQGQQGQVIALPETGTKFVSKNFLIIEPLDGIPPRYLDETLNTEDFYAKILNEKYFGTIRVQERVKL